MAEWSRWLDEHLLAPVPHRQVVLTLRGYVQAAVGECEAVPGPMCACRRSARSRICIRITMCC